MATNPANASDAATKQPARAEDMISRLSERLAATANVRNVYGEPIEARNRTIIPVAKVGYGVGAGAGSREGQGSGGGGGGGVGAKPAGYIEITDRGARFVSFSASKKIAGVALFGFALGFLVRHVGGRRGLFRR